MQVYEYSAQNVKNMTAYFAYTFTDDGFTRQRAQARHC